MSNVTIQSVKKLMDNPDIKKKFQDMLGDRVQGFFVSVSNCISSNTLLQKADPNSVIMAAGVAASLDLPIDQNLGFAYIVPYKISYQDETGKWLKKDVAQFQIGAKGFKQLAHRTGQFLRINATDVREGEIKFHDRLSGDIAFEWIQDEVERKKKKVIGYVSYFKLVNGFEQTVYKSHEDLIAHGKKYSQTFKQDKGLWKDDENSMMLKTVTKLNLSKNAPLSIELQRALKADQGIIKSISKDAIDVDYVDNNGDSINIEQVEREKQANRIADHINAAKTMEELEEVYEHVRDYDLLDLYTAKRDELSKK